MVGSKAVVVCVLLAFLAIPGIRCRPRNEAYSFISITADSSGEDEKSPDHGDARDPQFFKVEQGKKAPEESAKPGKDKVPSKGVTIPKANAQKIPKGIAAPDKEKKIKDVKGKKDAVVPKKALPVAAKKETKQKLVPPTPPKKVVPAVPAKIKPLDVKKMAPAATPAKGGKKPPPVVAIKNKEEKKASSQLQISKDAKKTTKTDGLVVTVNGKDYDKQAKIENHKPHSYEVEEHIDDVDEDYHSHHHSHSDDDESAGGVRGDDGDFFSYHDHEVESKNAKLKTESKPNSGEHHHDYKKEHHDVVHTPNNDHHHNHYYFHCLDEDDHNHHAKDKTKKETVAKAVSNGN